MYRFIFMTYMIATTTSKFVCGSDTLGLYFIYLTNLTYFVQLIYSIIYFVLLLTVRIRRQNVESRLFPSSFSHESYLPWMEKIVWILVNIVSVIPHGVTIGYWGFVAGE